MSPSAFSWLKGTDPNRWDAHLVFEDPFQIYLGDIDSAYNLKELKLRGIKRILHVTNFFNPKFTDVR